MTFEPILTISDYHDGPISGLTLYLGQPHTYERLFDEEVDEYGETFRLQFADDTILPLIQAHWQVWLEWKLAFARGERTIESHPRWEGENRAYIAAEVEIEARLRASQYKYFLARCVLRQTQTANTFLPWGESNWEASWQPLP